MTSRTRLDPRSLSFPHLIIQHFHTVGASCRSVLPKVAYSSQQHVWIKPSLESNAIKCGRYCSCTHMTSSTFLSKILSWLVASGFPFISSHPHKLLLHLMQNLFVKLDYRSRVELLILGYFGLIHAYVKLRWQHHSFVRSLHLFSKSPWRYLADGSVTKASKCPLTFGYPYLFS